MKRNGASLFLSLPILILWTTTTTQTNGGRAKDRRQKNRQDEGAKAYMCYSCSSLDRIECGADFNLTFDEAILCPTGAVCFWLEHRSSGFYSRGCSSTSPPSLLGCYKETVDSLVYDRCFCRRHYCNASPPQPRLSLTRLALSALVASSFFSFYLQSDIFRTSATTTSIHQTFRRS